MAFNPIEYLKDGKTDFVFNLTFYDCKNIVDSVRSDSNKDTIVEGFYSKICDSRPFFCFNIMYDMESRKDEFYYLINKGCYIYSFEMFCNLLENTTWGIDYILDNLDKIINVINPTDSMLDKLFSFLFNNRNKYNDIIRYISISKNLHIRALFINYIIREYPSTLKSIYPNLLDYLTSFTNQEYEQLELFPELMNSYDIATIAYSLFKCQELKEYYYKVKKFIISFYDKNDLAEVFLEEKRIVRENGCYSTYIDNDAFIEFENDADKLFETSRRYQFIIYNHYKESISKKMLERFAKYLGIFEKEDYFFVDNLYIKGLGGYLTQYIDKYLSLSKSDIVKPLLHGSTSCPYRIGDYVIKLFNTKWSYEDIICPNLYLIIKNLEEHYIRDVEGIVRAGLEVQQYLDRDVRSIGENTSTLLEAFKDELDKLGYKLNDTLINGPKGDNCKLLYTYKDADCDNKEDLPDWFKENPIVLIDRDRIYKKDAVFIKQLRDGY